MICEHSNTECRMFRCLREKRCAFPPEDLSASQPNPTPQVPAARTLEQLAEAVRIAHDNLTRALKSGGSYQREANIYNEACQAAANYHSQLMQMGCGIQGHAHVNSTPPCKSDPET